MDEAHSRTETGVFCLQCAGDILQCQAPDGPGLGWYECECGCACLECRQPMSLQEQAASAGSEHCAYRCASCGREANVPSRFAQAREEAHTLEHARRQALAVLTAALDRPAGSLSEDTRLGELGQTYHSVMFAVYQICEAFQVSTPYERLHGVDTLGELLTLIEEARRASRPDGG